MKPPSDYMAVRFTSLFVELVYKSPCYPALRCFDGLLHKLYMLGGAADLEDQLRLLSNLAKTTPEGDALPDMPSVSVFVRTPFQEATVYKSFVECRATAACWRAKAEASGKVRCDIVRRCLALGPHLPKSATITLHMALTLFDDESEPTLVARGRILISSPGASSMAKEWDARGPVGTLALLGELAPDLTQTDYASFRSATLAAAELRGEGFEVKNAPVKAAVAVIEGSENNGIPRLEV